MLVPTRTAKIRRFTVAGTGYALPTSATQSPNAISPCPFAVEPEGRQLSNPHSPRRRPAAQFNALLSAIVGAPCGGLRP
jgi:hypothetical protein